MISEKEGRKTAANSPRRIAHYGTYFERMRERGELSEAISASSLVVWG